MKVELDPVICCYCKKEFTPVFEKNPGHYREEFLEAVELAKEFLADGLPLECGECREDIDIKEIDLSFC